MNRSDLLMTPLFAILGCDAVLSSGYGGIYTLRAIDRTRGVPVTQNGVETGTLAPAAVIKAADLAANGLTLSDLNRSRITLNGKDWDVTAASPVPGPDGEVAGQVYLFLSEASE